MTPERWQQLKEVFHEAAEHQPGDRAAFLEKACGQDGEMRLQVESLLAHDRTVSHADAEAGEWLEDERARVLCDALREDGELRDGIDALLDRGGTRGAVRLKPGDGIGPYRVLGLIGAGGMGEVYKALDSRLGRAVALKLVSASVLDPSVVHRFLREARASSALNHPNICTVYDILELRGEPLLVLELLEGQTLDALLAKGPLSIRAFFDLAAQLADGLHAAHSAGIVHRDIKPANIFVTARGQAKILDFGLAKTARTDGTDDQSDATAEAFAHMLTRPGARPGTPGYMSPEQARGQELDARSDLFSLGLVLAEMATGHPSFREECLERRQTDLLDDAPVPLPDLSRQASRAFGHILRRAVAKHPEDRYQTALELRDDLARAARKRARRPFYATAAMGSAVVLGLIVLLASRQTAAPLVSERDWVQITNFSDSVVEPALSGDGKQLAFIRGPRTFTTLGQVYVQSLPEGQPRQLTADSRMKMAPVFSPDGASVAFTSIDANWRWDTWRVPVTGGNAEPFVDNASGLSWIGRRELLFSEMKSGTHMAVVSGNDSRDGVRPVYTPPRHSGMAHRSYLSPDRRWVLLAEMDGSRWLPCRLVPFDGSSPGRTVGPADASCTSGAWSPDGRWMYFSSNAGGAFHIWRQQFPDGRPQQVTSGPAEEEGIAMAPDGRSLITSVGTGISTVWIHERGAERPLSEQGHSFRPRFSNDGTRVFYLVSQRPGAYLASTGALWSADLASGHRRQYSLPNTIVNYVVDTDRNELVFVTVDHQAKATLWWAPLDGRTPPRQLAVDVLRGIAVTRQEILFAALEGPAVYVFAIGRDGRGRRKALMQRVTLLRGTSPDGRWIVVLDRTPMGETLGPIVMYPLDGNQNSRTPLCAACSVEWVRDGHLAVRYSGASDAEQRPTYLVPLPPHDHLPAVFRQGRLITEGELAAVPGVRVVHNGDVTFGADAETYVYPKFTSHRNLFRVPLD